MKYTSLWHVILILFSCFGVRCADSDKLQINYNKTKDETTTAVPAFNASTRVVVANETTPSTLISSVTPVTEKYTTSPTSPTGTLYTTKNNQYLSTNTARLSTTTAMPLGTSRTIVKRQFDTLSFMGGCLFTVTIITVGVFIWKMYEAKIERSYLTI
ncbi:uncharacterized protein LOC107043791 [Diachasma alloeum]|uniref:uncharacterized protein LOC107043791 n=1 Tax=Diachasma alloeum TaxID=454923 RepID=UPI000738104E|nr:uncharacterized protein LOC107043791 [Diachasma alloeum]